MVVVAGVGEKVLDQDKRCWLLASAGASRGKVNKVARLKYDLLKAEAGIVQ